MSGKVRDPREVIREEMMMRARIIDVLRGGPKTVPEIAGELGRPSHEVMCWVMGLRRYGQVSEAGEPDDDGYYRYGAAEEGD